MAHAVFSPLFSEIKRARQRAEADGKVAEVEGWLGRKGWQQQSLKMCCFSVTWRRPCHSSFFCLITHLSLRYTAQTPRLLTRLWHWQKEKKKERDCVLWTIQFDPFNLAEFIYSFSMCAYSYSGSLIIQFNSFLSFCFPLCLSERSHLTTALPISSTRHSLTTSTPHSAGPTGTPTNSVCLSSPDGHGIGKRDG